MRSPADTLFFVESGLVKTYKRGEDNKEIILQIVSSGEIFGEQALGSEQVRSIAAEVLQEDLEADPATGPQTRKTEVEETLPLLSTTGAMDAGQAEALVKWMQNENLIGRVPSSGELLTNDFVDQP